jgi:hypothetical protein
MSRADNNIIFDLLKKYKNSIGFLNNTSDWRGIVFHKTGKAVIILKIVNVK